MFQLIKRKKLLPVTRSVNRCCCRNSLHPLRRILHPLTFIIRLRLPFFNRQIFPAFIPNDLSNINDLPNMIGIMRQLPVNGIDDRERFLPDSNGL